MKHIPDPCSLLKKFLNKGRVILLLDFDGTISHIVEDPNEAFLSQDFKHILKELSQKSLPPGIITGRSIKDVQKRIKLKNIFYAGDHGFEIKSKAFSFTYPVNSDYKKAVQEILGKIKIHLLPVKGVILQQKKYSTSLHYRKVASIDLPSFRNKVKSILKPYLQNGRIKIFPGKKVYEIKPPVEWDKGKAVEKIIAELKSKNNLSDLRPLYIGDDVTDEDAFRSVNRLGGISIRVGKIKQSRAKFFLSDIQEVLKFLKIFSQATDQIL